MAALYEDVEVFFGDIFAWFGRFLSRHPVAFIVVSLLANLLMAFGLLKMTHESRASHLYAPAGSQARDNNTHLRELFPDQTNQQFYEHQLVDLGHYADIIFQVKSRRGNILTNETIDDISRFDVLTRDVTLDDNARGHSFTDLCASRDGACVVSGLDVVTLFLKTQCLDANVTHSLGEPLGYLSPVLGNLSFANGCARASAFRLRYNLKQDTQHHRRLSVLWQRQWLAAMTHVTSDVLQVRYSAAESLDTELGSNMGLDTAYFSLTICIMIVYAAVVSCGGDWVSTRLLLALAGILAALLAIMASFGLLSLLGLEFVDICGVMPFLILGEYSPRL